MIPTGVSESEIKMYKGICGKCRKDRYDIEEEWKKEDKKPTGICDDEAIKIRKISKKSWEEKSEEVKKIKLNIDKVGPCPMLPAIYKKSGEIDVMLITESHGGAVYKNNSSYRWLNNEKTPKEGYFDAGTFHAYEIRKILLSLDELKLNWYLTDVVKCYVAKIGKNLDIAAKHCFKNYLLVEIKKYKPKIIVIFGWKSYTLFKGFIKKDKDVKDTLKNFSDGFKIMGNEMTDKLEKLEKKEKLKTPVYLFFPFPSQSAANSWSELKTRIEKQHGTEKDNNHHPVSYLLKEIKNRIQ